MGKLFVPGQYPDNSYPARMITLDPDTEVVTIDPPDPGYVGFTPDATDFGVTYAYDDIWSLGWGGLYKFVGQTPVVDFLESVDLGHGLTFAKDGYFYTIDNSDNRTVHRWDAVNYVEDAFGVKTPIYLGIAGVLYTNTLTIDYYQDSLIYSLTDLSYLYTYDQDFTLLEFHNLRYLSYVVSLSLCYGYNKLYVWNDNTLSNEQFIDRYDLDGILEYTYPNSELGAVVFSRGRIIASDDPDRTGLHSTITDITCEDSFTLSDEARAREIHVTVTDGIDLSDTIRKIHSTHLADSINLTGTNNTNIKAATPFDIISFDQSVGRQIINGTDILAVWYDGPSGPFEAYVFKLSVNSFAVVGPGTPDSVISIIGAFPYGLEYAVLYDDFFGLTGPAAGLHDNYFVGLVDIDLGVETGPLTWECFGGPGTQVIVSPDFNPGTGDVLDEEPIPNIINIAVLQGINLGQSDTTQAKHLGQTMAQSLFFSDIIAGPRLFRVANNFILVESMSMTGPHYASIFENITFNQLMRSNFQFGTGHDFLNLTDTSRPNLYKPKAFDNITLADTARPNIAFRAEFEFLDLAQQLIYWTLTRYQFDIISFLETTRIDGAKHPEARDSISFHEALHYSPVKPIIDDAINLTEELILTLMRGSDTIGFTEALRVIKTYILNVTDVIYMSDKSGRMKFETADDDLDLVDETHEANSDGLTFGEVLSYFTAKPTRDTITFSGVAVAQKKLNITVTQSFTFRQGMIGFLWNRNLNTYSPYLGVVE